MKKHGTTIILVAVFLIGLSVLLYPTVADLWNSRTQSRAVAGYTDSVGDMTPQDYTQTLKDARDYNKWLAELPYPLATVTEEENGYGQLLNVGGNGVMGYLEIAAIGVKLPIYHGTTEGVLQVGIGHMLGSSLPVGGLGTHAVLTGHTGLPSSKILTDLDRLQIGDWFDIHVLGDVLRYRVDQILTVEPHETESLAIDGAQDYATLVTCTPYGINSHRLLVRGSRIAYEPEAVNERVSRGLRIFEDFEMALVSAAAWLVLEGLWCVRRAVRRGRRSH